MAGIEFNQAMKIDSFSDSFPSSQVKYRCNVFMFLFKDFLVQGQSLLCGHSVSGDVTVFCQTLGK